MKTKTWILLICLLLAVCLGASLLLLLPGTEAAHAQILRDGQLLRVVDLKQDQEFTVETSSGGYNVITVKDGKIAVTEASCPDHYCMDRGFCSSGAQIVCLPNRLVIQFAETSAVDAVVE